MYQTMWNIAFILSKRSSMKYIEKFSKICSTFSFLSWNIKRANQHRHQRKHHHHQQHHYTNHSTFIHRISTFSTIKWENGRRHQRKKKTNKQHHTQVKSNIQFRVSFLYSIFFAYISYLIKHIAQSIRRLNI